MEVEVEVELELEVELETQGKWGMDIGVSGVAGASVDIKANWWREAGSVTTLRPVTVPRGNIVQDIAAKDIVANIHPNVSSQSL